MLMISSEISSKFDTYLENNVQGNSSHHSAHATIIIKYKGVFSYSDYSTFFVFWP